MYVPRTSDGVTSELQPKHKAETDKAKSKLTLKSSKRISVPLKLLFSEQLRD